jgi:signal transduction histidine kinase
MGQLAAGVAHDLSNLISPILGYSQVILRKRDVLDPSMVDIIERILRTSRRANTLLRQMVTLSRTQTESFEPIEINPLIDDILLMLEIRLSHTDIEIDREYDDALPMIYGSQVPISQVILNIIVNAMDAMADGGRLTLKTSKVLEEGGVFVEIEISDSGHGIAPHDLPHIFDAFYTTKSAESGTGLGLSVSKDIVDNHHGRILVDSIPGRGTTFIIRLPVNQPRSE